MNTVNLIGRLTRDPELRTTPSGTSVASFSVAVDRAGDRDDDGTYGAGFFDCTAWGNTADTIAQYLTKGRQVGVSGELRHHRWQNDAGETRSKVEVNVRSFTFCGSRDDGAPAPAHTPNTGASFVPSAADDDIPF